MGSNLEKAQTSEHGYMLNPNNQFCHSDVIVTTVSPRRHNMDAQDVSLSLHSFHLHVLSRVCFPSSPPSISPLTSLTPE